MASQSLAATCSGASPTHPPRCTNYHSVCVYITHALTAVLQVGDRRWQPPQPLPCASGRCWKTSVLNASSYRPACFQSPAQPFPVQESEDCLHLTVWVPHTVARNNTRPADVLVFFHGGDLTFGSANFYNMSILAAEGPVVVVAVNYRLNLFGFLATSELTAADPRGASGNLGLMDMQESLRWVNRNIKAFGGNPLSVTLLGQSSGGTAVLALLASPASKGLFHRAISLSGSPNVTMDLQTAQERNRQILQQLNCSLDKPQDRLSCLLNSSTEAVRNAVPQSWIHMDSFDFPRARSGYSEPGVSIVDGVTVVQSLESAFSSGRVVDVPLLIGTTAQEIEMCPPHDWRSVGPAGFETALDSSFAAWGQQTVDGISQNYAREIANSSQLGYASMISDMRFTCGNIALARKYASAMSSPVYSYVVTYRPSHPWRTLPCIAAYDSPFSFHKIDLLAATENWNFFHEFGAAAHGYTPSAQDVEFGAMLRHSWYTFARSGRVGTTSEGTWRTVTGQSSSKDQYWVNLIGSSVSAHMWYKADTCNFWHKHGFDERFWLCN